MSQLIAIICWWILYISSASAFVFGIELNHIINTITNVNPHKKYDAFLLAVVCPCGVDCCIKVSIHMVIFV